LLDPPFAVGADFAGGDAELAGRFAADAALSVGWDVREAPDPAAATVDEQLAWLAGALAGGDHAERDAVIARLRRRFEIFGAHSRLLAGYRPAGPAVAAPTLIVSADR